MTNKNKTLIILSATATVLSATAFGILFFHKKKKKFPICENWTETDYKKAFSKYLNKKYPKKFFKFGWFDSLLKEAIYEDADGNAFRVLGNVSDDGRFLGCIDNYAINVLEKALSEYVSSEYCFPVPSNIYISLQHCYDFYTDLSLKNAVPEILDKYVFDSVVITVSSEKELPDDEIDDFVNYLYSIMSFKKFSIRFCVHNRPLYKTINN